MPTQQVARPRESFVLLISSKTYLETKGDVDAVVNVFCNVLKAGLMTTIDAGQKAPVSYRHYYFPSGIFY